MKRFYKTTALVSLLGISNFSYGTLHGAGAIHSAPLNAIDFFETFYIRGQPNEKFIIHLKERGVDALFESQITALHFTATHGLNDIAYTLLYLLKANVNARDGYGQTPLHTAIMNKRSRVARTLLASPKIDVNARDLYEQTPLHTAAQNGYTEVVRMLLASPKIDVNARDLYGQTPLHIAIQNGHIEVVRMLLASPKVEVNPRDLYGQTPLHEAVLWVCKAPYRSTEIVELLLRYEADKYAETPNGNIPFYIAASWGHANLQTLLSEKSLDPSFSNPAESLENSDCVSQPLGIYHKVQPKSLF
ncbi:MAG: ankyrin repeat domain-containing protein [Holosporales bacterium]|jgi:ankyrin repeat protein|nr:ankyrin repeat domain-containing protein [Holosporales bacterium]